MMPSKYPKWDIVSEQGGPVSAFLALTSRWIPTDTAMTIDHSTTTYAALEDRALRTAGWLRSRGVHKGSVVAVQLPKCLEFLDLHLATLALGAILLPLHPDASEREVSQLLQDSDARILIRETPNEAISAHPIVPSQISLDTVGVLLYTSGTTGRPKGARITHQNLLATVRALHQAWAWERSDVLLHALPLFHVHGLFVAQWGALWAGARSIWLHAFSATEAREFLPNATIFMGVPTFYHRLITAGRPATDLSNMRLFTSGSAPLPATQHREFQELYGHTILERYGMTEVGIVLSNPYVGERRAGSVGFPLPGVEARVCDETDTPVPTDTIGEIQIRSESVIPGYLNRPQATREALRGGWMHTGDLGRIDKDGYYYVVGRASDMAISGGYNIYPREVEAALLEDPAVAEVAVFGIPDVDLGERLCAAIVPASSWAPEQIVQALSEKIARYKLPRRVFRVQSLPRNAMGKVQKTKLRQRFQFTIREAKESDLEAIVEQNIKLCSETENRTLTPSIVREGVRAGLCGHCRYWVAERGDEIVAQIMITTEWSDWQNHEVWWLQSVYVQPPYRGHGVLDALFEHVHRLAKRQGAGAFRLYVDSKNTLAKQAYRRLLFHPSHYELLERTVSI